MRLFAENTTWARRTFSPDGTVTDETTASRGACTEVDRAGVTEHRIVENVADDGVLAVFERPQHEIVDDEFILAAKRTGAEITVGAWQQHIAVGAPGTTRSAERFLTSTEVRLRGEDGTSHAQVLFGPGGDIDQAAEDVRARLAIPFVDELPQADLVLQPGRAGAFFHEVVGHPMEADVVASDTSYLGALRGQVIAPEWLTVVDGGQRAEAGFRSSVDDEGTPCRDALLIDRGRVGEPMTDLALAERLGVPGSGHARRQSYRHPAIPRMTHTCGLVGEDASLTGPEGPWIAAHGLKLQVMNIASGDFVFTVSFALLHKADGTVRRLGPFDVVGNGLDVLRSIRPYSREVAEYGRVTGGCGKLGQFPVPVTFANAGVCLPAGSVVLREVRRG
ncbi:metallopeptidase TldD-related protein [Lentzea sp. NPDC051213]|uniref:metallopeptidase TldD-related protein n=1 Tax=Lentzea sp. NPDC051213 TaxID=3364126 RepID=UPI0037B2A909